MSQKLEQQTIIDTASLEKIKKDIFNSNDLEEASAKFLTYEESLKEAYIDFVRALCRNKQRLNYKKTFKINTQKEF